MYLAAPVACNGWLFIKFRYDLSTLELEWLYEAYIRLFYFIGIISRIRRQGRLVGIDLSGPSRTVNVASLLSDYTVGLLRKSLQKGRVGYVVRLL